MNNPRNIDLIESSRIRWLGYVKRRVERTLLDMLYKEDPVERRSIERQRKTRLKIRKTRESGIGEEKPR